MILGFENTHLIIRAKLRNKTTTDTAQTIYFIVCTPF